MSESFILWDMLSLLIGRSYHYGRSADLANLDVEDGVSDDCGC